MRESIDFSQPEYEKAAIVEKQKERQEQITLPELKTQDYSKEMKYVCSAAPARIVMKVSHEQSFLS